MFQYEFTFEGLRKLVLNSNPFVIKKRKIMHFHQFFVWYAYVCNLIKSGAKEDSCRIFDDHEKNFRIFNLMNKSEHFQGKNDYYQY